MTDRTPVGLSVATSDLDTLRQQLLDLFCELAYQKGDFVLSSGQRSSYYINGKQVTLHPQGALAIGRILVSRLPANVQAVAGLTLGADPIVTAVSVVSAYDSCFKPGDSSSALPSESQGIPALIVRKEPKGHGTQAYIEGPKLPTGATVVVLEDVVTTGQSALKAVERLRQAGYSVDQVIALVDRQQGGAELYQQQGLKFEAIFSIDEIEQRWNQLQV